jgi:hypothetical protein
LQRPEANAAFLEIRTDGNGPKIIVQQRIAIAVIKGIDGMNKRVAHIDLRVLHHHVLDFNLIDRMLELADDNILDLLDRSQVSAPIGLEGRLRFAGAIDADRRGIRMG